MTGGRRTGAGLRLAATLASLLSAEAVLVWAGTALPPVPLDGAELLPAVGEAEPLPLAVSVLRLVALAVGAGLLVTTALGILARGCGAARLVVRLDRWTPPGLRHLLDGALGVGLAATIGLSAVPAGADPGGGPAPSLRRLPDAPATTTLRRLPDAPSTTTLRRLADAPSPPTTGRSPPADPPATLRRIPDGPPAAPAPPPAAEAAAPRPAAGADPREVVVRPGDSFWRLAERHEAERLGRTPTETEVGACWQELVAVNRHRLAVPDDPDLLFPGQVLVVPCH